MVHNESRMLARRSSPLVPSAFPWRIRVVLWAAVLSLLPWSACSRAPRPDFSGAWELDVARSNFGPVPGPSKATHVIEHHEPLLKLTTDSDGFMGENHAQFEFVTDGSEKIQTIDGKQRMTHTHWDGVVLVTEWKIDSPGQPAMSMTDRRSLSADRQTLTVDRKVVTSWTEWTQKAVFVRKTPDKTEAKANGQG